jgi:hypothetical protein
LINNNSLPNSTISDLTHLAKLVKLGVRDLSNRSNATSGDAQESEPIAQLKGFINFVSNSILEGRVARDQVLAKVLQTAGTENRAELAETAEKIFDNALKAIGLSTQPKDSIFWPILFCQS